MKRHLARMVALASLCMAAARVPAADHAPPPLRIDPLVEQFMQAQAVVSASLSPDGKHIAAIALAGKAHYALLIDTATHAAGLLALPRHAVISNVGMQLQPYEATWIDDTRVAVNFTARHFEYATGHANYGEVVGLDGKPLVKLGHGMLSIQRDDAGKPTGWVVINSLNPGRWFDRVNIDTRETEHYDFELPDSHPIDLAFDPHGDILAVRTMDTTFWSDVSRIALWTRRDVASPWVKADERSIKRDALVPVAASKQPGHLVVLSRNGGDRVAAWDYDAAAHAIGARLAGDDHDDLEAATFGTKHGDLLGFSTSGMKPRQIWLEAAMTQVQATVDQAIPDHVNTILLNGADSVVVWSASDVDFGRLSVFDPRTAQAHTVFTANPEADPARMQPMQVIHYPSTDGLSIPAYLTMPGHPTKPAPLVVLVHGGPVARDRWRWQEDVQMLAAHGYAVLQPQFRGSAGFGLKFEQAGYQQWGRLMQDDVSAGVRDLVARKLVDPARVCIVGGSYGGYAALWGLASTPELYKCGVDVAGVSDIEDMVLHDSLGSQSAAAREIWSMTIGDPKVMRDNWAQVSPRRHADRISAPVLIVHGDDDRIVPISQGKAMRDVLIDQNKDVQWLAFDAEGHGVSQLVDRRIYYGAMLELLARTIGEGEPPLAPTDAMVAKAKALAAKNGARVWLPRTAASAPSAAASAAQ